MSVPCPVCSGATREAAGLLECRVCGLSFRENKFYAEPDYAPGLTEGIYGAAKTHLFSSALDFLGAVLPGRGRLLDVGCATGVFMKAAAGRGWEAEGVELSAGLAAQAVSAGFTVHTRPVEEAYLEAGSFDVVTLFEVFGLMPGPALAAGELYRLLKPGGVLYAREYNASFHLPLRALELRGFFRPLGARPSVVHAFNYTPRSLRLLLARAGFRDIKIRNSRPTSGDPYRTGGALGGVLTGAFKVLYYYLSQALWLLSFGRVYSGPALIVTARK